jgi:hypothetical protein
LYKDNYEAQQSNSNLAKVMALVKHASMKGSDIKISLNNADIDISDENVPTSLKELFK